MTRPVRIEDARGVQILSTEDLPLTVGTDPDATICLSNGHLTGTLAFIGLSEGIPFVQSASAAIAVLQNGKALTASQWLRDGDVLEIGSARIHCQISAESLDFRVQLQTIRRGRQPPLTPPASPRGEALQPVAFKPSSGETLHKRSWKQQAVKLSLLSVFGILGVLAWFLFTARFVALEIKPAPDQLEVKGGMFGLQLGGGYLGRPGRYRIIAAKVGYRPLKHIFQVTHDKNQVVRLTLEKLPGQLAIRTKPAARANVFVDDTVRGTTPLTVTDLEPGLHQVLVRAERYQDARQDVAIEGLGIEQLLEVNLVPNWALVTVTANPADAVLWVDGERVGQVPTAVELLAGEHDLELRRNRYKTWRSRIEVVANEPQALPEVILEKADGVLRITSRPTSANITVNGQYAGQTPVDVLLSPGQDHEVAIFKRGYELASRTVRLEAEGKHSLFVELPALKGIIQVTAEPMDAELLVDGKPMGHASQRLSLIATPHSIEVRKQGYETFRTQVTPRENYAQALNVRLRRIQAEKPSPETTVVEAPNGHQLKLIAPGELTMGASRREQGRRSNETLRKVALTRPFYLGTKEVTNQQFRQFQPAHYPGHFLGLNLATDEQPVVNLTWEQAAAYCNWLSTKESLPHVYEVNSGKLVAKQPIPAGYRLPTEAEWAWAARMADQVGPSKFPWGSTLPPAPKSGNYADDSAAQILANTLKSYNDGYPITAPPGTFDPNPVGLYDLGGNVAEWTHDYYTIYASTSKDVEKDPAGPAEGKHHVIRGSSWMHASISALRWTFRDYSEKQRPDVGFRIARHAN